MAIVWKWLLEKVMNYVVGKDIFGKIKQLVADVALNSEMTGAEKKEKVLADAKEIGQDFASHMLNLAIEAAVMLLKDKSK